MIEIELLIVLEVRLVTGLVVVKEICHSGETIDLSAW
jgi:hypothetical protein